MDPMRKLKGEQQDAMSMCVSGKKLVGKVLSFSLSFSLSLFLSFSLFLFLSFSPPYALCIYLSWIICRPTVLDSAINLPRPRALISCVSGILRSTAKVGL